MTVIYTEAFEARPSWFAGKGTVVAGHTGNAVSLTGTEAGTTATAPVYTIATGDRSADTTLDLWFNMSNLGTGTTRRVSSTPVTGGHRGNNRRLVRGGVHGLLDR